MSTQPTEELVTKQEALERVNQFIERPGTIDVDDLIELFKWQAKLVLWILQESNQDRQTPTELVKQLTIAKSVSDIARVTAQLLSACGVHNTQGVGQELARISVTAGMGKN
jgi:hypothetical protein